jgi:hypothetical protein
MPRLTWTLIPPICASCIAGVTGMHHHAQPLIEMGSCELFAQIGLEQGSSQSQLPE